MSEINYQALREAAEAIKVVATPQKLLAFRMKVTPQVVLALLDEIKRLEDTNIDAMCRIAELETNLSVNLLKRRPSARRWRRRMSWLVRQFRHSAMLLATTLRLSPSWLGEMAFWLFWRQ